MEGSPEVVPSSKFVVLCRDVLYKSLAADCRFVLSPSFGIGTYTLHFCADFSGADIKDTGVFMNNRLGTSQKACK